MFDGSLQAKHLMQMFEYLLVLRYLRFLLVTLVVQAFMALVLKDRSNSSSLPSCLRDFKPTLPLCPPPCPLFCLRKPASAGENEVMALSVELDACWLAKPDIVAKLRPSNAWALSHVDIRPAMYVEVDFFEISGILRLSFPLQNELPIFNGMAICFMQPPKARPSAVTRHDREILLHVIALRSIEPLGSEFRGRNTWK
jgi:hypothetical protein